MKNFKFAMPFLLIVLVLTGCSEPSEEVNYSVDEIGSIAYNVTKIENLVYIPETDKYAPYVVLTNDYNGNTLLMRKHTLGGDLRRQIHNGMYERSGAYYRDSQVDKFLNGEFYDIFSESVKNIILTSEIEISSKKSFRVHGREIEKYNTKVFLLSINELYYVEGFGRICPEGEPLEYFSPENAQNLIAPDEEGWGNCAYWTRSADTGYWNQVFAVDRVGRCGSMNSWWYNGVRPSFCLDGKTKIRFQSDIVDGKNVYVIDFQGE